MGRITRIAVVACALVALAACEPATVPTAAPEALPGRHGAATAPLVHVFGDSLTPVVDHRQQAAASGYAIVADAQGGSWMCGGSGIPQADGTRWWPRILDTILEVEPDFVVLEYQAWANYQLRCGGPAEQFPYDGADPGRAWRAYLQMFVDASIEAGGRTRLVVVESPSAPASLPAWSEPQRITDEAARTMAQRLPGWITYVPIRQDTMVAGQWSRYVPCKPYDVGYRSTPSVSCWDQFRTPEWPAGQVPIHASDDVHHWCPTETIACSRSTPAGLRIRRAVFTALNRLVATPPPAIPPGAQDYVSDPKGPGVRTVLIADDEVSAFASRWRRSGLAQQGPLAIHAHTGDTFASPGSWATYLYPSPERAVIALGTNDVVRGGWTSSDAAELRRLAADRTAGAACVVLTTVGTSPQASAPHRAAVVRANEAIRALAASDVARYRLADWATRSAVAPARTWRDQTHVSAEGSALLEAVVAEASRTCPDPA